MLDANKELKKGKIRKSMRKLLDLFDCADDQSFLHLVWAVNVLQSSHKSAARGHLTFPLSADTEKMTGRYSVYKWELETLLLLFFSKTSRKHIGHPALDCRAFNTMAVLINELREIENYESAVFLDEGEISLELYRNSYRQFGWQRGFATSERLYRFAMIYGQGKCGKFFQEHYGISVADFMEVCLVLYTYAFTIPWSKLPNFLSVGLDPDCVEKALKLLVVPITDLRTSVGELIKGSKTAKPQRLAYMPSAFRRTPIVHSDKNGFVICPLPQLIMLRATEGLYFDIRAGHQSLMTEANDRFEQYTREVIEGFGPNFKALPSEKYGPKKAKRDTPDVLLEKNGSIAAVFECKATKLTYNAQYSDNPMKDAANGFAQIVKAIKQLWRFFSHVRRGIYEDRDVAPDAHGIVLTMDAWMYMSGDFQQALYQKAEEELVEETDITDADKRRLIFCPIQDLADLMFTSNEKDLLAAFGNARLEEYSGWGIREIMSKTQAKPRERKDTPFDIKGVLPWWGKYTRD